MQHISEIAIAVWNTAEALAPSLFLGLFLAGVLHVFVKKEKVFSFLGKPGLLSSVKASLVGVPLPLCSCGVLPTALGLRKDGASKGAAVSFLASTPQTGIDSIAVTWSMLGWPVAVAKVVAAFAAGIVSGTVVDAFERENEHEFTPEPDAVREKGSIFSKIWRYAFDTLFRSIYVWLFVGVIVSAVITVLFAPGQLADYPVLAGPAGMLAALAIGIPLYVCSVSSVPIAAALVYAGFPVGSALVFLMAGPATNAATMGAVRKSLGKLSFWSYLLSVVGISLLAGFLLNGIKIPAHEMVNQHHVSGAQGLLRTVASALFFAGIAFSAFKDISHKLKSREKTSGHASKEVLYEVSGMTCQNCVRTVYEALSALKGVEHVTVSLEAGTALVQTGGGFSSDAVLEKLSETGHSGVLLTQSEESCSGPECTSCRC